MEITECEITDEALNDLIETNLELGLCYGNQRIVRATVGELKSFANEIITKLQNELLEIGVVEYPKTGGNAGIRWTINKNGAMPKNGESVFVKL